MMRGLQQRPHAAVCDNARPKTSFGPHSHVGEPVSTPVSLLNLIIAPFPCPDIPTLHYRFFFEIIVGAGNGGIILSLKSLSFPVHECASLSAVTGDKIPGFKPRA